MFSKCLFTLPIIHSSPPKKPQGSLTHLIQTLVQMSPTPWGLTLFKNKPHPLPWFVYHDFPGGSEVKVSAWNAGDQGSIPGSGRSLGEGNGNPLQYSCLENPMEGGAWWATVHGVAKSRTRLSDFTSLSLSRTSLVAQTAKRLPTMQVTRGSIP